jgi:hypothetical protein
MAKVCVKIRRLSLWFEAQTPELTYRLTAECSKFGHRLPSLDSLSKQLSLLSARLDREKNCNPPILGIFERSIE